MTVALKVRVHKLSGYVEGPCAKCGKETRGIVMLEDLSLGADCLSCGYLENGVDAEFIDDPEGQSFLDKIG